MFSLPEHRLSIALAKMKCAHDGGHLFNAGDYEARMVAHQLMADEELRGGVDELWVDVVKRHALLTEWTSLVAQRGE